MPQVIIYTTDYCPYCVKAKNLLTQKNVTFEEVDITHDDALRAEVQTKSGGRRTVPQIFIDGEHIGGCDDLYDLNKAGKLDMLLGKAA